MNIFVYLIDGVVDSFIGVHSITFMNGNLSFYYERADGMRTTYTYNAGSFTGYRVDMRNAR